MVGCSMQPILVCCRGPRHSMEIRFTNSRSLRLFLPVLLAAFIAVPAHASPSLGLSVHIVSETPTPSSVPLVQNGHAAPLFLDRADWTGVLRAASDLQSDIERVSGTKPTLTTDRTPSGKVVVIAGTIGKSPLLDRLIKSRKVNVSDIAGKWESFVIVTVKHPLRGVNQALVIAGSDKRGTIYGLYEISEQIGVSPWYWWADVPPQHHPELFIKPGTYVQGPPAVKYRGIFINDEDPCLSGWAKEKFGGVNSKMYAHMFELILRMRGNYLWPAMWGKAFNEDDPLDPKLADEYGIVMGTSHHEPMMRAQQEWTLHHAEYGNGEWNYQTNADGLRKFWTDGMERNKKYENIVTIGMRGDGDLAMPDAGGFEANKKLLEQIINDQRQIIAQHVNPNPSKVPQVWTLFTEVQKYWDAGLRVPDDVTILFADDNVGDLRRLPTPEERKRSGGFGIYFHMDMHGGPYSYQWLNSNPLPKIWEQMNIAYRYGARQIWIANVGDLKPLEIPIEFFLRMAWDPEAMTQDKIANYQLRWAEREFGKEHAAEIADIAAKYAKYNGWRKPELLQPETFSLIHYHEAERVSKAWSDLAARSEKINAELPQNERDAFYELVLHPVEACANLNQLYIAAGRNHLFAEQGRASANIEADVVRRLFRKDRELSDYYNHTLAGGKWNHMMDQTHLGYTAWYPPPVDVMPAVSELILPDTAELGVAAQGAPMSWPNYYLPPQLPVLDSINKQRTYLEVFPMGKRPIEFTYSADKPWIRLTEGNAFSSSKEDRRIWVDIDWDKAPVGESAGNVTIAGEGRTIIAKVTAIKASDEQEREAAGAFGGLSGPIAIAAHDATENIPARGVQWKPIPDYGRVSAGMEVFPVTAASVEPPNPAPQLEYPVFFGKPGKYEVDLVTAPTLDAYPGRPLALAVSIDDQSPQVVKVFIPETQKSETFQGRDFYENARNNARIMRFNQTVGTAGRHTLKITMVDPTIVLEKIIIHDRWLAPSYFGPPAKVANGIVTKAKASDW
jgi:hypothetical protein